MSSQYLNQPNKNATAINVGSANVYDSLTCGGATGLNDTTFNGRIYKASSTISQLTSPTTTIDANFARNLIINTQIFTTPHSNNNSTSFLVTNFDCQSGTVVNVNIQKYSGTGLPIVTGIIADDNNYQITIINLHKNTDLDNTFELSLESKEFI
tara:strand:+ start:67 stop:528 length:462 start_codon:yes stop_codon:yes gene_type:complete